MVCTYFCLQIFMKIIILSCRIRSDHNEDGTLKILRPWLGSVEQEYHSINSELRSSSPSRFSDEETPTQWSTLRFEHVIKLKEEALTFARYAWADFIWVNLSSNICLYLFLHYVPRVYPKSKSWVKFNTFHFYSLSN